MHGVTYALRAITIFSIAVVVCCGSTLGGGCDPARYQILGRILDGAGQPIPDARVRLLLDRVPAERFAQERARAQMTRTGASGAYLTLIDCERSAGLSDAPDPCAAKPRFLTVAAEAEGYRLKLTTFRLKDLEVIRDEGGCLVQVKDVRLSR